MNGNEKDHYVREGFFFPLTVYEAQEAKRLHDTFQAEKPSLIGKGHEDPHLRQRWILEITRHPKILDFIEQILGPDIFCMNSRFFAKEPGGSEFVSWHQDGTYCGLADPRDLITAWVALTEVTVEAGAVRMIPRSHDKQREHEDTHAPDNMLTRGQRLAVEHDESNAVDVVLHPGQVSFHHPYIIHGSPPNRSAGPRIGLGIQYIATRAKPIQGFSGSPMLVRGNDRYHHFTGRTVSPQL